MQLSHRISFGIIGALSLALFIGQIAYADSSYGSGSNTNGRDTYTAALRGANEVPAVATTTTGDARVSFNTNGANMQYQISVANGDEITAAHLHCGDVGENGPVVAHLFSNAAGLDVNGSLASGGVSVQNMNCTTQIGVTIANASDLARAIESGDIYVNVHSEAYPDGVIRGQLAFSTSTGGYGHASTTNSGYGNKHRTDGYWDSNKNWHYGMASTTENGYWGDDNCWNERSGNTSNSNNTSTNNHQNNGTNSHSNHDRNNNHDSNDTDRDSWNSSNNDGRGTDGKDGKSGRNVSRYESSNRTDSNSGNGHSVSSVRSFVSSMSNIRVHVR